MTLPYAITRKRNPTTGDGLMAPPPHANEWAVSTAPMTEVVAMTMRTQLGACVVDLGLGVDWQAINRLITGAASTARYVIEQGLARYVGAGLITNVVVTADVIATRVEWTVNFTDPRTQTRPRIAGNRSLS